MTYEETYMKCNTLKELEDEIARDIRIAIMINPDRVTPIKKAGEKVANLKFKNSEVANEI